MTPPLNPDSELHHRHPHLRHAPADRSDVETSASESDAGPGPLRNMSSYSHTASRLSSSLTAATTIPSGTESELANGHGGHRDHTDAGYSSSSSTAGSVSRAKKGARKHQFRPRTSHLDSETLNREPNKMGGFFTLFWMAMAWYTVTTAYNTWNTDGVPFRMRLLFDLVEDGWTLAKSDLALVLSCFTIVVFQKLIKWGVIPLEAATPLQHIWQGTWFATIVFWTFYRNWRWGQTGFFTLHGISMLMKQHSYMASNTEMHQKLRQLKKYEAELATLKKAGAAGAQEETDEAAKSREARIIMINIEIESLRADLTRPSVTFPNNITFVNFVDYMLVPTLVYELEYPRTPKFRPLYFLEKAAATLGTFFLLYITVEHYILPILALTRQISFVTSIMQLIIPFMVCYLLIFYIIFECICNAFAELTRFADREFYEDWWNSCTFDEYARKWNKPVHEFLLRHVYLESISSYKLSRQNATLLTFFVSSCFHEVVMAVTGKRIRMYLFLLQMLQLPLIYMARIPAVKRQKLLGNMLFWFGMFLGPPLLGVAYSREHWYYNPEAQ
ncbi:hypothetical protein HDU76_003217 [Blyttiomyces sp. JEL0837]|nr:hypothetical protein HDU76_003217 [Blyttiomyces sp. JEL0837]